MSTPHLTRSFTVGELLDRAFRLYRTGFAQLALIAAIFLIPFGILSGLFTGQAMSGYFDFIQVLNETSGAEFESNPFEVMAPVGSFVGVMMLVMLFSLIVTAVVDLALVNQTVAMLHGQTTPWQRSIREGFSKFIPYVLMNLLKYICIGLVGMVSYLVIICAVGALALGGGGAFALFEGGNPSSTGELIGMVGLGILFVFLGLIAILGFFTPVFYVAARWLVTLPSLVVNDLGPVDSLRNSWSLTQGKVRRCIFYALLIYLLSAVAVGIPAGVLQQLILTLSPPEWQFWVLGASAGLTSIFTVLWQPLAIAAITLFYFDLRAQQGDLPLTTDEGQTGADWPEDAPPRSARLTDNPAPHLFLSDPAPDDAPVPPDDETEGLDAEPEARSEPGFTPDSDSTSDSQNNSDAPTTLL